MQASTEDKQRYLRQQIIQSNYDPEEFVNFLKTDLQIQELDVESMQMETLESIVLKFKQYKFYLRESQNFVEGEHPPLKRKKIEYEKNGVFDYEFEEQIKCVQIQPFSNKLEVYVPNVEVIEKAGIFFTTTQIWFVIKANLNKYSVKRTEEDFMWLSGIVNRLYPLLAVPELVVESKEHIGNHEKRRKELEQYLQILAGRDQMRRSPLFHEFLTFPPEKMEKMKKTYESMSFVRNIHSLKNDTGSLNISLSSKLRSFCLSTENYLRKSPKLHQSISDSISKVTQYLDTTSKQIYKIVDSFAELHELYNQITNKSPQYKQNQYSQILININNLYHTIANDLITKSNTITSCLKEYSKIQLNYDRIMYQIYKDLCIGEKQYIALKANLNKKKERLYPDITKWEVDQKMIENRRLTQEQAFQLMLPRETNNLNLNKKWIAYLYCNYRNQFQNCLKFQTNRYSEVYCTFCSELLINNKTYVQEVTKFIEESRKLSPS